jgi:hypothetical protein
VKERMMKRKLKFSVWKRGVIIPISTVDVDRVVYDDENETLDIPVFDWDRKRKTRKRKTYRFFEVDNEMAEGFDRARSPLGYFTSHIRHKRFERIE